MINKLTLSLLIFSISVCSHYRVKNNRNHELEKYSYMMVGIIVNEDGAITKIEPLGTCFFLRQDTKLYLLTARHNITGISSFDLTKTPKQFDYIGFRYVNTTTKQISISKLDIRHLKSQLKTDLFYISPDAIALEMNDPIVEPFIYSLESYIVVNNKGNKPPKNIFSLGYPYIDSAQYREDMSPIYYKGTIVEEVATNHSYPKNDLVYFISTPKSIQGMSGAPVFYIHISETGKSDLELAGVIFGKNEQLNYAYIAKITAITNY